MKKIKVKINTERCIGCAGCIILAPQIFEYNDNAKTRIQLKYRCGGDENVGIISEKELIDLIKKIASLCPTYSIKIEEIN